MKEECETCEWRSSEIGYASRCPAHEIKSMTTLKQFQEEGGKDFDRMFSLNSDGYLELNFTDNSPDPKTDKELLKSWHNKQTSLAYELGKKEMLEMVVKEIEKIDFGLVTRGKAEVIVTVKHKLKRKLLALNEE